MLVIDVKTRASKWEFTNCMRLAYLRGSIKMFSNFYYRILLKYGVRTSKRARSGGLRGWSIRVTTLTAPFRSIRPTVGIFYFWEIPENPKIFETFKSSVGKKSGGTGDGRIERNCIAYTDLLQQAYTKRWRTHCPSQTHMRERSRQARN